MIPISYVQRNSRVGYIQGHADVMCFILANTTTPYNEEEAFWIYAIIVERYVRVALKFSSSQ